MKAKIHSDYYLSFDEILSFEIVGDIHFNPELLNGQRNNGKDGKALI